MSVVSVVVLSGRGLCDELITRPEESYRLRCVVVCGLETSRICAPYIHDISSLRVKDQNVKHISRITLQYYIRNTPSSKSRPIALSGKN